MYNLSLSSAHAFCPYKNENVLRFSRPNPIKNSMQIGGGVIQQKSILQPTNTHPNQLFLNLEEEQCCSHLRYSRKISKVPFKVLDAPALQDDFYLNLIDWSSQNILAVGLSSCVYLWRQNIFSQINQIFIFDSIFWDRHYTSQNLFLYSLIILIDCLIACLLFYHSLLSKRLNYLHGFLIIY